MLLGHPWVFANEVEAPLPPATGDEIPPSTTEVRGEPPTRGPSLLAPDARKYDPNEETMIGRDADVARARAALAAKRPVPAADNDEEPTGL